MIQVNAQLCTGCRICELICAFTKHGEFNPKRSSIRIVKMERIIVDVPVLCRQCDDPACVAACPADALSKETDGVVCVDEASCTGCGSCREACPFDAVSMDPVGDVARICDLCHGEPQCVKWCPTGAIVFDESAEALGGAQRKTVSATARSLVDTWGIAAEEYEKYCSKSGKAKAEGKKEATS